LGVAAAGFRVELLIERDPGACGILQANLREGCPLESPDTVVGAELSETYEFDDSYAGIDLLTAGPPCQPFSTGGKRNGHVDERDMFPAFFHAVRSLRPRAILVENVSGLTIGKFRDYFSYLKLQTAFPHVTPVRSGWPEHKRRLEELKRRLDAQPSDIDDGILPSETYEVWGGEFNAADFGVPQLRRRAFIVAFRRDQAVKWAPPSASHARSSLLRSLQKNGSYWQDHPGAKLCVPSRVATSITVLESQLHMDSDETPRWRTVRDAIECLPEPKDRVSHPGFRNHVGIPGARIYAGHSGSVLDWPAKTIKCGVHGIGGGENVLVKEDGACRWFTIRECALLQAFPLDWDFGDTPRSRSMRYVGNAVPPPLAEKLAGSIKLALSRGKSHLDNEAGSRSIHRTDFV